MLFLWQNYLCLVERIRQKIMDGCLPARVRGLVDEWVELHQDELLVMWESHEFHKIAPLVWEVRHDRSV
ncbi:MAG: DUF4160 domain-containing protein [Proteobacteria bacterium]|nr:DUF4160 domain-containing protein [Pseudomonadota bacterium]